MTEKYSLVQLANGAFSVRSNAHAETFHPVIGPIAEAEALYVRQLRLVERIAARPEEFFVWDVGLGAAGNPLVLIRAVEHLSARLRVVSFDATSEPLAFALGQSDKLTYISGFESTLRELLDRGTVRFKTSGGLSVDWEFHPGDFPSLLQSARAERLPKPDAIFYDAFSPAKNPAMWSLEVFAQVRALLDPNRACSMPTYSRSTLLRVTLLLAGFYVGVGHATGEKEETTVAANTLALLEEPLDREWLFRAKRSRSAEPLRNGVYRQAPLSEESWEQLRAHPQFK